VVLKEVACNGSRERQAFIGRKLKLATHCTRKHQPFVKSHFVELPSHLSIWLVSAHAFGAPISPYASARTPSDADHGG
jgi:hypothetical protein